jgi:pyruvate/2-oxoglutarate dehydrogenase complex dihydrolipoamide acyltransferase (E2) component
MSVEVRLPQIGFSVTEGTLVEWLVADGKKVEEGVPLYMLELEKSVQEVVAPGSGTLKIKAKAGEIYQVGDLLGEIV